MQCQAIYPFVAIVGQEAVKKAISIALVNQKVGGLLIGGEKGTGKSTLVRSTREIIGSRTIVVLPINATEDMLFGGIDMEYAVSKGVRKFSPGILGKALGNVLYIDEANLLRQEVLTAVLDANISGINQVERDGISFVHEVKHTIIATMNPEEGVLPRHILDRFGMYVDVRSEKELSRRVEIMRKLMSYSNNNKAFIYDVSVDTEILAKKIEKARSLLTQVEVSEAMIRLAVQMCTQAFCSGHRAEIYLLEAAKATAALDGRRYVAPKDIEEVAVFVLAHRRHEDSASQPQNNENEQEDQREPDYNEETSPQKDDDSLSMPEKSTDNESTAEPQTQNEQLNDNSNDNLAPKEQISAIDTEFCLPKMSFDCWQDKNIRRGSGKRSRTKTDLQQGRYVRSALPKSKIKDLAFDATIRVAAPLQKTRTNNGCALKIESSDLRQKIREKRIGKTVLFAVDASGSMGARERMRAVKGAIFCMLQEAYQKRDRVGMIAFRRQQAAVLLPITRSVDLAQKCLAEMATGGKTPLVEGLSKSLLILQLLNKKDRELEPILILVTDGRANASGENGDDPIESALKIAEKIRKANITAVVIDTETDFIKLGIAKKIAQVMGASYYSLQQLSQEKILRIVRNLEIR